MTTWMIRLVCGALLIATVITIPAAAVQQPPAAATEEYVPVDPNAQAEQLPAAPLVMAAYAVVWLAAIFYIWSLWRRLGRVEQELAQITRRVDGGR